MGRVLLSMSVSLDGFSAGPDVGVERPMGEGGERLHEWMFHGNADQGVNAEAVRDLLATTGATVVGRRMFDVGVGLWQDTPYPLPCVVLTHEPREDRVEKSGTFIFVTGVEDALRRAREAAGGKDVLVMGGAHTARQFVRAGLVDEIRLQLVPVLLGAGTRLFDHLDTGRIELERTGLAGSPQVTHLCFRVVR
ncbi:dihydrofolate reductase [Actinomadura craniellae]|uniref:Dihydrofolate reductase n=1 Tax=Actinomadura craniellae TaxID=2231787 RepID=A0A365GWR3_9ACTN|nr:dihydrofolate reductase family protein [Actinomadura craniellae]RAY11267.1 dihydrofolate reductase [Actinomadura craniellae]